MLLSPSGLLKRVGVGGQLVPFFKCVCAYFLLGAGGNPSLATLVLKCAPILCLLACVLVHHHSTPYHLGGYSRRVAAGLALSAVGDALLVWPQYLVGGMAAFAGAHVSYLDAFRFQPRAPLLAIVSYTAAAFYLTHLELPTGTMQLLVPMYTALLATMAWRAVARCFASPSGSCSTARLAAAAGALFFLVSDAILGYNLFGAPLPHRQALVMSTYYVGQLGIALSALETYRTTGVAPLKTQ